MSCLDSFCRYYFQQYKIKFNQIQCALLQCIYDSAKAISRYNYSLKATEIHSLLWLCVRDVGHEWRASGVTGSILCVACKVSKLDLSSVRPNFQFGSTVPDLHPLGRNAGYAGAKWMKIIHRKLFNMAATAATSNWLTRPARYPRKFADSCCRILLTLMLEKSRSPTPGRYLTIVSI